MANKVTVDIRAKTGQATSEVEGFKRKLANLSTSEGFKSVVSGVGMGVGMAAWNAVGGAISQAGEFLRGAVTAASDLAESTSKAQVVFGDAAATLEEFAQTSATAFGISKRAALEAAGTYGNLLVGAGIGQQAAADMSTAIVGLAADLASFNNQDIDSVMGALRSGLTGEAEPLKRFGVLLNASAVQAEAMRLGLGGVGRELTEGEKVQARYSLILRQTGTAQGDFARTSDGLANIQRTLDASLADVTAEIGQMLLPIVTELMIALRDHVIPTARMFFDALGAVGDAVGVVGHALNQWGASLHELLDPLGAQNEALEEQARRADEAATARLAGQAEVFAAKAADAAAAALAFAAAEERARDWAIKVRDELPLLGAAFKEVADKARANRLDEAWDIANLPDKIIVAKAAVVAAQKELEEARGRVARAEASIRLRDAQKELFDLEQALRDAGPGALTAAGMLGRLVGRGIYDEVVAWNRLTRREIEALGDPGRVNVAVGGPERRARGGPVDEGRPYLVGEEGPELFVPGASGQVVPGAVVPGAGGAVSIDVNVSGPALFDPYGLAAQQMARVLLPGLRRELSRQGMSLG